MNRLAGTTSSDLLQHNDNPVDWWPWSAEAFAEAQRRDVPVPGADDRRLDLDRPGVVGFGRS